MSSEQRLVKRATRGDARAFEEIYQRYHQELYRFCLAMVGNAQDAQDTLQNTMLKVLRALPGEERQIQLKPWLYRIARNESVETLRKRRDNAELEPHQAISSGVTETVETRERLRTLLADLKQLPERQRAALVLRELSGLDFDQIGATFETSPAVARQTLYEARLSLRQLEAGREMRCADVMKELSNADGRVTRRREIRAHLRGCADCRAFRDDIAKRHEDLAALTPLPLAASTALLQGVLGETAAAGGVAAGGGGLAGIGATAGKAVATSTIVKSAATVAVVAVVGVSAADRGGLIDLPRSGKSDAEVTQEAGKPVPPDPPVTGSGGMNAASTTAESGAGQPAVSQGPNTDEAAKHRGEGAASWQPQGGSDVAPDTSPSQSQAGIHPPGGGHGRSASQRKGRPEHLPDAATQGQQTAATKKPPHAASPPGKGASGEHPKGGGGPANTPASPPKAKGTAAAPAQPPAGPPQHADSDPPQQGAAPPPPGFNAE